ncbi:MAG: tRNA pseudouridine(55) synthase TruB [Clostridia bacterium]|nr:tRNA pseudouridine(55) synthase TruB [Clostridia bacterium]
MADGIIIIDKPEGVSSFSAVARIRRLFGERKVGHTGTLDPLATGVLPILVGRAVKASDYLLTSDKHYIATLKLGIATDTEDITGTVISRSEDIPTEAQVREAVAKFIGSYEQTPPMYSAIKVGGKKLYELAREGKTIEREARTVTIENILVERIFDDEYTLDVTCSKGTYIRTLCSDIGAALGCFGTMKTLRRKEAAGFTLSDAIPLDALENMSEEERKSRLLPTEVIFEKYRAVHLPDFFSRLAHSGLEIYLKKISEGGEIGERVRMCDKGGFFALGEIREFEDGLAIKPIKQF